MRAWAVLAVVTALVTGCTDADPGGQNGANDTADAREDPGRETIPEGVGAPELVVGTSFTFRNDGIYDGEERFTTVVARADERGYLLAGATEADLPSVIAWGRPFFGEKGRELTEREGEGMYDFPLVDGKTWSWGELEVTATAARVVTPGGAEDGFEMRTTTAGGTIITWTYAPSIGFLTQWSWGNERGMYENALLESVGTSTSWVWYEELGRFRTGKVAPDVPLDAQTFEPPGGTDAWAVSAGGMPGNHVVVTPPPGAGQPWTFESADGEAWATTILPAAAGPWTLEAAWPQEGYAHAEIVAVTWLRP